MRFRTALTGLLVAVASCMPADQTGPVEPDYSAVQILAIGSIAIIPDNDTILSVGAKVQLTTTVKDQTGKVLIPGPTAVRWASLNPKRASVTASGLVTSLVSTGQARITATAGTRVDTALITIMPAPLRIPSATASTVTITPSSIIQSLGIAKVTITLRDSAGLPIPNGTVQLTSSGTGNVISSPPPTDSAGVTTATFSSTTAETKTITASANGVVLAQPASILVRNPLEAVATVMTCAIPAVPPAGSVNLVTDLTYSRPNGIAQKLDVAWPKTAGVHPVVVVIHGGGWYQGDKSKFRNAILQLAAQGYTAVAVNYRLVSAGTNIFPAAVQDLRCALRWVRVNAAKYSLDANRGAAVGVSAGAHLAQLLGFAPDATSLDGQCGIAGPMATIQAVVSYEGPSDLRSSSLFTSVSLPAITDLLGGAPETVPVQAASASPITYRDGGDPPALLVHGTADSTVPSIHSAMLKDSLNQSGVPATYIPVPAVGHNLQLFSTTTPQIPATCTMTEFLSQELQP
jgi:acetyl esterase/lipase